MLVVILFVKVAFQLLHVNNGSNKEDFLERPSSAQGGSTWCFTMTLTKQTHTRMHARTHTHTHKHVLDGGIGTAVKKFRNSY